MRPYFETPVAGGVLLVVVLCWLLVEFAEFLRVQAARASRTSRTGATKTRSPGGFWVTVVACLAAAEACLYGAPHVFPAAAIRPGGPYRPGAVSSDRPATGSRSRPGHTPDLKTGS